MTAWGVLVALVMPLVLAAGCGGGGSRANAPPIDDSGWGYNRPMGAPVPPQAQPQSTMRRRLVTLAGAAALYYMYKKHNSQPTTTPQTQYYLSRNGRVYYRDAGGQAHWVTAPPEGIKVPESEAAQYRGFQGYENSSAGRDLTGLPEARL